MIIDAPFWWAPFLVALFWWFPQNAQHEGSHALVAVLLGARITRFIIYPTNADEQFSLAFWRTGFTWASVSWENNPIEPDDLGKAIGAIAPNAANTLVLSIFLILDIALELFSPGWLHTVLTGIAITNFADGAYNLSTFYRITPKPSTDGWKFQAYTGLPIWLCRMLTPIWQAGFGVWLLFSVLP